ITLDRNLEGPDHKASIDVNEFRQLCTEVRRVTSMLGNGEKIVQEEEKETRLVARKSVVSAKDLKKGHALTVSDINVKRPGTGISAIHASEILGSKLTRDVEIDEVLFESDIEL
ncbi:MAG: N-acetylneuraminate synthase family protein, partial [Methylophilaceae bacterium]|nr:N-acetylneuraminate synthase family protein [Methylophilaceae bacterium]